MYAVVVKSGCMRLSRAHIICLPGLCYWKTIVYVGQALLVLNCV